MTGNDLVVVMLPGVQQFLGESRTTADVAASSKIMSRLAAGIVEALPADVRLVFPRVATEADAGAAGLPNRVVLLAPEGSGDDTATALAAAARDAWHHLCADVCHGSGAEEAAARLVAESVGFPSVRWVVVRSDAGEYRTQWRLAGEAIDGRKRIRDFSAYDEPGTAHSRASRFAVCGVSGRWARADGTFPIRARLRRGEELSAPVLVKRAHGVAHPRPGGYPSTWSVAAATFRRGVIDAIENPQTIQSTRDGLFEAVRTLARAMSQLEETGVHVGRGKLPGLDGGNNLDLAWLAQVEGSWLFPDNWNPRAIARDNPGIAEGGLADLCEHGRVAAWQLIATSKAADLDPPAPYLAVLVQDADKMGDRLADRSGAAGSDLLQWHAAVSGALVEAARVQGQRLEKPDLLGWTIYAGGDDMLGFVPVRSSLAAVREVNASFVDSTAQALPRASASTALLFFHASSPLQSVLSAVRDLLAEAKEAGRPGLGIAALRRGGERVRLVRSWWADPPAPLDTPAVICLEALVEAMRAGLSGRLATALERDGQHLAALSEQWLASEVRRLVRRHSRDARGDGSNDRPTPEAVADSLLATAGRDPDDWQAPRAMVLARFIESVGG